MSTTAQLSKFPLPGENTGHGGTLINYYPNLLIAETRSFYEDECGNIPNITYKGEQLIHDLISPKVYARRLDKNEDINVTSEQRIPVIFEGSEQSLKSTLITLFKDASSPDKICVVLSYSNDLLKIENYKVVTTSFTIPKEFTEGITTLEMYLLAEDPKTSRGTVTTVVVSNDDVYKERFVEENVIND